MELQVFSTVLVSATAAAGQQPYDVVDLASVKSELDLTGTKKDAALKRWITQASAAAAKFCDRVFPIETVQDLIFPPRDSYPIPVAIGGENPLQLSRRPIACSPSPAGTAPPLAPVLTAIAGGALAAAALYVKASYVTAAGETAASLESLFALAANNLLQVASPAADAAGIATGWNVYIGTKSFGEVRQNATPLPIGTAFTLPVSGLVTMGAASLPPYILVVENNIPLAEGVDFIAQPDDGQLVRFNVNGRPRRWPALPTIVQFPAGYALDDPDFADAQDAVIRMVKGRYFSQKRDPALRSENLPGAYEAQYWFASGPGAAVGNMTPDVEALLEKYRAPAFGAA